MNVYSLQMQEETLDDVDGCIDEVTVALEPFFKAPLKVVARDVAGVERARLHASHAYSLVTLLYST